MGMKLAKSVWKAKPSWDLFGQRWTVKMSVLGVGVSADTFGLRVLPAFTWAGRMGMACIYHMEVMLLNLSISF